MPILFNVYNEPEAPPEDPYTYYYDGYSVGTAWDTNPENMVDGSILTLAVQTGGGGTFTQLCNHNTAPAEGEDPEGESALSKLEIRAYGRAGGTPLTFKLQPTWYGSLNFDGTDIMDSIPLNGSPADWSSWYDITSSAQSLLHYLSPSNDTLRLWHISAFYMKAVFESNEGDGPGDFVNMGKIQIRATLL